MGLLDFLKENKEKDKYGLGLDVGTEMVKALIFEMNENGEAEILGVGRKKQRLSDMQGGAVTDISGVVNNSRIAIRLAEEMAGISPKQAVIGIAGELVKGTTLNVHYTRKHPGEPITESELKKIVEKAQERSFEKARAQIAFETGSPEVEVRLVNSAIIEVRIDGYKVQNPINFQGRDVTVGIFNAFAPVVHFGALTKIAENLDLDLLSVAVEPYALARSLGLEEDAKFSAIFIDVGGGTTDVALVRNGGVEGTKMFALGGRTFTKKIASEFDISFAQAEEIKLSYSAGSLDFASKGRVKKTIWGDAEVWLSGVELVLSEFKKEENLPSRILLCGGGSNLPEIKRLLMGTEWQKNLPLASPLQVEFIKTGDVVKVIDKTGELSAPSDITPMALAGISLELIGSEGVVENMLEKIVKMIKL